MPPGRPCPGQHTCRRAAERQLRCVWKVRLRPGPAASQRQCARRQPRTRWLERPATHATRRRSRQVRPLPQQTRCRCGADVQHTHPSASCRAAHVAGPAPNSSMSTGPAYRQQTGWPQCTQPRPGQQLSHPTASPRTVSVRCPQRCRTPSPQQPPVPAYGV